MFAFSPLSVVTALFSCFALTDFLGLRAKEAILFFSVFAEAAFVDDAIAVVVDTVAGFVGGENWLFTRAPSSLLAGLEACMADALAAETQVLLGVIFSGAAGRFRIAGSLLPFETGFGLAVGDFFIDLSIAIVIDFVARFGGGELFASTFVPCVVVFAAFDA